MSSFVYVITDHSLNNEGKFRNKLYIGKSFDPIQRMKTHIAGAKSGMDTVFYRAMRAHGVENFSITEIHECVDDSAAFQKEIELISERRTYIGFDDCMGYNSTLGGDGIDSESSSANMKMVWERDYELRCAVNKKRWEDPQQRLKQSMKLKESLDNP